LQGRGLICPGAMLVYPRVAVGIPYDAWCSPAGLLDVFQAGLDLASSSTELSCFLSVTWHGEILYRLGVQCVKVLILLGTLFLPSMAPASQQDF
jgi:hypothetical protein